MSEVVLYGLVGLALLELLVVYALLHWWLQRRQECAVCAGRLAQAHAALRRMQSLMMTVAHHATENQPVAAALNEAQNLVPWVVGAAQVWHHVVRGTQYAVVARDVRLNCSGRVSDGDLMWLYQDLGTGRLSVREANEFTDGRFQLVARGANLSG